MKFNPLESFEFWIPHPSHPQYLISSFGKVKGPKGSILLPSLLNSGYLRIDFGRRPRTPKLVHMAVGETFLGRSKEAKDILNHINGDKRDNRVINLEITTMQGNAIHARDAGLTKTKLDIGQVSEIREKLKAGDSRARIAELYQVTAQTIGHIYRGDTWY